MSISRYRRVCIGERKFKIKTVLRGVVEIPRRAGFTAQRRIADVRARTHTWHTHTHTHTYSVSSARYTLVLSPASMTPGMLPRRRSRAAHLNIERKVKLPSYAFPSSHRSCRVHSRRTGSRLTPDPPSWGAKYEPEISPFRRGMELLTRS